MAQPQVRIGTMPSGHCGCSTPRDATRRVRYSSAMLEPGPVKPLTTWTASGRHSSAARLGAHLSLREADPRLDRPETPHSRSGGPLDLDHDRRPHPAPARPPPAIDLRRPGRNPPSPTGSPRPGSAGVQEHSRSPRLPGACSQTPRHRTRTTTRRQEQTPGTPLRRRRDRRRPRDPQGHRQAWKLLPEAPGR